MWLLPGVMGSPCEILTRLEFNVGGGNLNTMIRVWRATRPRRRLAKYGGCKRAALLLQQLGEDYQEEGCDGEDGAGREIGSEVS